MKLALLNILDIHKTINKKFHKVVKKRSMQTQYVFEGVELWLRWDDFPSAPRVLKTIRDYGVPVADPGPLIIPERNSELIHSPALFLLLLLVLLLWNSFQSIIASQNLFLGILP